MVLVLSDGDNQKCVDEYGTLLVRYPSDTGAYNNMADCLTRLRNIPKAMEEVRHAVAILPKRAIYHGNLALYSAYGGDFQTAAKEAAATLQLNPSVVSVLGTSVRGPGARATWTQAAQAFTRKL